MPSAPVIYRVPRRRPFLGLAAALLGAAADGQFIDGGAVPMICGSCACEGVTDDGQILVFDSPSTGNRIVSVDGELSGIAETSCGTSIFAAGNTIYELSGVDLVSREFEAVDMSGGSCDVSGDAPPNSDCYSGVPAERTLDDGVSATFSICWCIDTEPGGEDSSAFKVQTLLTGASVVGFDEIDLCDESGFTSALVAITVAGKTYSYNYELVIPGMASSADLSVASAPDASAQASSCGDLAATSSPSASPLVVTSSPSASPTTAPTPAPIVQATIAPANTPNAEDTTARTAPTAAPTGSPTLSNFATRTPVSLDDGTAGTSGASPTRAGGGLSRVVATIGVVLALGGSTRS